jgi:hypothetical protein
MLFSARDRIWKNDPPHMHHADSCSPFRENDYYYTYEGAICIRYIWNGKKRVEWARAASIHVSAAVNSAADELYKRARHLGQQDMHAAGW